MTTATILLIVFNFVTRGDHTYKAIWTLDICGHSELWVKDGYNHDTFVVVVIMTVYSWACFESYNLPYHLLQKICTCSTIWGCATIKIIHKNKIICTRIVTHCATFQICATNRVNTVTGFECQHSLSLYRTILFIIVDGLCIQGCLGSSGG